jgi:hypothetical protein
MKLQDWIDKYLVPVYQKEGWVPTAIFLILAVGIVALAVWLGGVEIVGELLR